MAVDQVFSSVQVLRSSNYWGLFRSFLTLTSLGSHDASAQALGISKSTLTRRIKRLEAVLHTKLYYRHAGDFLLTPRGIIIAEKLRQADEILEVAINNGQKNGNRRKKKLRIFVKSGPFYAFVLSFLQKNPNISKKYSVSIDSDCSHSALLSGDFEIIISGVKASRVNARQIHLGHALLKFYASEWYCDKFDIPSDNNLDKHSIIMPTGFVAQINNLNYFKYIERKCMTSIRVSKLVECEALVRAGLGFGLISPTRRTVGDIEVTSLQGINSHLWLSTCDTFAKDPENQLLVSSLVSHARSVLREDLLEGQTD